MPRSITICDLCGTRSGMNLASWALNFEAPLADRAANLCPDCRRAFEPAVQRKLDIARDAGD